MAGSTSAPGLRAHRVDATELRGQFLLTGSVTSNHKGILHSGTGCIGTLRMRPMSLYESGDSDGTVSLQELCDGHISPAPTDEVETKVLIELILRGGWPGSIGLSDSQALRISQEYLKALVNDDVFKMDGVQCSSTRVKCGVSCVPSPATKAPPLQTRH